MHTYTELGMKGYEYEIRAKRHTYSLGKKDSTLHRAHGVKLPLLRVVMAGQGLIILPLEKRIHFFLRSLTLSVLIYRHFQSNRDNWRCIQDRRNFFT